MSTPPAFQFYASDFAHSTALLTAAATGAHIRMMCHAWDKGPIPDHPVALAKAMGLSQLDPPFVDVWTELQPKWTLTKKGWICRRLERTRRDQEDYRERRRKAGQKGANARYGSHSNAIAEPSQSDSPQSLSLALSLSPSQPPETQDQDHRADARQIPKVLIKLAHQALDEHPDDATEALKDLVAAAHIEYQGGDIQMALSIARSQRPALRVVGR